jgi:hypothetical protein
MEGILRGFVKSIRNSCSRELAYSLLFYGISSGRATIGARVSEAGIN